MSKTIRHRGKYHTEDGYEVPDTRPPIIKLGSRIPKTWEMSVAEMFKKALSNHAQESGRETWEEANDFDCPEEHDELELTPYEDHFDHEENFMNDMAELTMKRMSKKVKGGSESHPEAQPASTEGGNGKKHEEKA